MESGDQSCAHRRRVLAGCLATVGAVAAGGGAYGSVLDGVGCTGLTASTQDRLAAAISGAASGPFSFDNYTISETSGDARFDRLLGAMLIDLAERDGVRPSFAFYDDAGSPNAFAIRLNRAPNATGSVLFGRTLLNRFRNQQYGDMTIMAVCAHEFGHIVQQFSPFYERLMAGQTTVRRMELHADYLSGHYIGMRSQHFGYEQASALAQGWMSLGDTGYTNPQHHGTPAERLDAIQAGHALAKTQPNLSIADVCERGAVYVGG